MLSFCIKNYYRLLVYICIFLFIFNEYVIYLISSLTWPSLRCGDIQKLYSVMLVADPQVLGEQTELWLARWDNDRYLRHSFELALRHVQPDLVIFLGDNLDEGHVASDDEFQRYYWRFKNIFQMDRALSNKTMFVPGDNDIGGEDDLVMESKVNRFNALFLSPTDYKLGSLHIIQVDKMQHRVPTVVYDSDSIRMVVSHMPVLGIPSAFAAEVIEKLRPHLIVSAHDHKSVHFSADMETGERTLTEELSFNEEAEGASSWRFQMYNRVVNEVVVPTCSYRMGVAHMGFGVALIDRQGEAWCYHILWISPRFPAIAAYLLMFAIITASLLKRYFCRHRRVRIPTSNTDSFKLLIHE